MVVKFYTSWKSCTFVFSFNFYILYSLKLASIPSHFVYVNMTLIYMPLLKLVLSYVLTTNIVWFIYNKWLKDLSIFKNKYFIAKIQFIYRIMPILILLVQSNYVLYI